MITATTVPEKVIDTLEVIKSRKLKDRKCQWPKKKIKKTNNYLQSTTQKTKD